MAGFVHILPKIGLK